MKVVKGLFGSRKFWALLLGLVSLVAVALGYEELPVDTLADSIVTIVGVFIGSVAIEDFAAKFRNGGTARRG